MGASGGRQPTLRFGGRIAWLLWLGVHIVYLIGFRNRVKVLVDWGWRYLTSRGAGAILMSTDESPAHRHGAAAGRYPCAGATGRDEATARTARPN